MGVSTDGILVYGIDLSDGEEGYAFPVPWSKSSQDLDEDYDEDAEEENEDGDDIEEWWTELHGVTSTPLWDEYYEWERGWKTGDYADDNDGVKVYEKLEPRWRQELDKYYEESRKTLETLPVEVVYHCSYEYSMYFLALKGYYFTAYRGSTIEISTQMLEVPKTERDKLQKFCEEYNIKYEPKWYLASMWG